MTFDDYWASEMRAVGATNFKRESLFYALAKRAWHAGLDTGQKQGAAEAWQQGYHQGVQDERTSEANIGIAGFGAKVEPARINPYLPQQPVAVDAHELWAAAQLAPGEGIEDGVSRIENILHHTTTQPAAVDGGMVERALNARYNGYDVACYIDEKADGRGVIRAALTAALAALHGGV